MRFSLTYVRPTAILPVKLYTVLFILLYYNKIFLIGFYKNDNYTRRVGLKDHCERRLKLYLSTCRFPDTLSFDSHKLFLHIKISSLKIPIFLKSNIHNIALFLINKNIFHSICRKEKIVKATLWKDRKLYLFMPLSSYSHPVDVAEFHSRVINKSEQSSYKFISRILLKRQDF